MLTDSATKRRLLLGLSGVLVAILLSLRLLGAHAHGHSVTQALTARPSPSSTLQIGLSFGDDLRGRDSAALVRSLDDAVALGASWVRVDFDWAEIQPQSATGFDWAPTDRIARAAAARHIAVLPVLAYTPPWARPPGCVSEKCAPHHARQFAAFAAAAVWRYTAMGVHAWEIWNEPNVDGFWQPEPDPAGYAELVRVTARAMKAVNPSVGIISGGLAPASSGHRSVAPVRFLREFCRAGGQHSVDAIGYHPYTYPVPPQYAAPWNAWAQIAGTKPSIRSVLVSCGIPHERIWITENGAPTNGPGVESSIGNYQIGRHPDHVSEALQAAIATESVRLARRSPYIAGLFWYSDRDIGADSRNVQDFFGLRRFDGTKKPAYSAFRRAVAAAPS